MTTNVTLTRAVGLYAELAITLTETGTLTKLAATIEWGDGQVSYIPATAKTGTTLDATAEHTYMSAGQYHVVVDGHNFRHPVNDHSVSRLTVNVGTLQRAAPAGFIVGPLAPPGEGVTPWALTSGHDLELVASDIRVLLLTTKGERLMDPDFGTNIGHLVFEPDTDILESVIRDEVTNALSRYEPRASLVSLSVDRPLNENTVLVICNLAVDDQSLSVGLNF